MAMTETGTSHLRNSSTATPTCSERSSSSIRHRGLDYYQRTVLKRSGYRRGIEKNKTGITVAGILGGLAIVLIAIIVIIQTGVWATVAPQFGLPAITSIGQIL